MPTFRRLTLTAALVLGAALAAAPAAAGCKLAHNHACARPGAACRVDGRGGFCETVHHPGWRGVKLGCLCATPISHGGGGHRK